MPTILTHAAVPAALAIAAGPQRLPVRVMLAGVVLSMLPDADVIGLKTGMAYAAEWGHRGASHSIMLGLVGALVALVVMRPQRKAIAFAFLALSAISHGLLDALTSGGLGPALLWPWTQERFFAPVTPIRVSPFAWDFKGHRALAVLASEARWVWLPCAALALTGWLMRRRLAAFAPNSAPERQSPD